jgi:hypothetical protein
MIQNWGSVAFGWKLVVGVKSGAIYKANTAKRYKGFGPFRSLSRICVCARLGVERSEVAMFRGAIRAGAESAALKYAYGAPSTS